MQCRIDKGNLIFEGDINYTLDMTKLPNDEDPTAQAEKLTIEWMVVRKVMNSKAWANYVTDQLRHRMSQLEHRFMELAADNIVRKG